MKIKRLMLATFLLLAILTIGAVSAYQDADISDDGLVLSQGVGVSDDGLVLSQDGAVYDGGLVLSQDTDDALSVDDSQEDLAENPSEETVAGGDAENAGNYEGTDDKSVKVD